MWWEGLAWPEAGEQKSTESIDQQPPLHRSQDLRWCYRNEFKKWKNAIGALSFSSAEKRRGFSIPTKSFLRRTALTSPAGRRVRELVAGITGSSVHREVSKLWSLTDLHLTRLVLSDDQRIQNPARIWVDQQRCFEWTCFPSTTLFFW
jgi:hypothetical protein